MIVPLLQAQKTKLHVGERLLVGVLVTHLEGEIDVFQPSGLRAHPAEDATKAGWWAGSEDLTFRRRTRRGMPSRGRKVMSGSGTTTRSLVASNVTLCASAASKT